MGYPHPDILLDQIDSKQVSEWMAYYQLEPFGSPSEHQRSGVLASILYNANRAKGAPAKAPVDFFPMLKQGIKRAKQSWQEQKKILLSMFGKGKNNG